MAQSSSRLADAPPAEWSGRLQALDALRAAAIVAVLFAHAGSVLFSSPLDRFWRSVWVAYHVPAFLFVSGMLYASHRPLPWSTVGARLTRVGVPYLVACAGVWALGVNHFDGPADFARRVATGSVLGIYYYVFLLVSCIALIWPLSRLPRAGVLVALACAYLYPVLAPRELALASPEALRNPLNHYWAYFLTGWTAALYRVEIARLAARIRPLLWALCVWGVGFYWLTRMDALAIDTAQHERVIYSLSVIGLAFLAVGSRELPARVRALSDASLTIYLYHPFFIRPLREPLLGWPELVRVLLLVGAGLLGSACIVWLGRRLLGARSKLLLGS